MGVEKGVVFCGLLLGLITLEEEMCLQCTSKKNQWLIWMRREFHYFVAQTKYHVTVCCCSGDRNSEKTVMRRSMSLYLAEMYGKRKSEK